MLREENHYLSPEMREGGGSKKDFGEIAWFRRNAKETSGRQTSIKTVQK